MLLRFYIICRWVRLTTRRYGSTYIVIRYRPRHAGVGRGLREQMWGRAHGDSTGHNITTADITALLEQERSLNA